MRLSEFIRNNLWAVFIDFLFICGAVKWGFDYFSSGYITDARHGIQFHGYFAFGHLAFSLLGSVVLSAMLTVKYLHLKNGSTDHSNNRQESGG